MGCQTLVLLIMHSVEIWTAESMMNHDESMNSPIHMPHHEQNTQNIGE